MSTGLTTVFTPRSACLGTYVLDSWFTFGVNGDTTGTSLYYLVGDFQVRSSNIEDKRALSCTPEGGGILFGIQYFSPGLSCPLGWTTQPPEADDGTTNTVYCCPSTLRLEVNSAKEFVCMATLDSDTIWYQSETEEATTYTEICLPQNLDASDSIIKARISATPIMLLHESSDLEPAPTPSAGASPVPSPSPVPPSSPRFDFNETSLANALTGNNPHSSISKGTIAAISIAAALSVILFLAACLYFRAWRRRSSNNDPQPEASAVNNSSSLIPCGETKAEMEDPVSARELFKQSGAYQGKPELGNEVDRTHVRNPDEADMILPSGTQSHIAEDSLAGNRDFNGLGQAYPAELE